MNKTTIAIFIWNKSGIHLKNQMTTSIQSIEYFIRYWALGVMFNLIATLYYPNSISREDIITSNLHH